jgi:hypothetical protein
MVRRCVLSRNLKNEEAMTRIGLQRHSKKRNYMYIYIYLYIWKIFLCHALANVGHAQVIHI